jgi:hypothetical protein
LCCNERPEATSLRAAIAQHDNWAGAGFFEKELHFEGFDGLPGFDR